MTIALETKGLEKSFGGLRVTRDLSLKVEQGARHALIGPNGAGKTTVINLLTGVLKPNGGRILLEGNDITDLAVHTRVLRGLSRTFQINQLYADLTPLETVGLAVSERLGRGGDWWRRMGTRADVNEEIAETLSRFHLLDVMNELTATLRRSMTGRCSTMARRAGGTLARPPHVTRPLVGWISPIATRSSVVLPAPFGPISTVGAPGISSSETRSRMASSRIRTPISRRTMGTSEASTRISLTRRTARRPGAPSRPAH